MRIKIWPVDPTTEIAIALYLVTKDCEWSPGTMKSVQNHNFIIPKLDLRTLYVKHWWELNLAGGSTTEIAIALAYGSWVWDYHINIILLSEFIVKADGQTTKLLNFPPKFLTL